MAENQAASPATPDNSTTVVDPAKDTVLTGAKTQTEGTAPLAKGAATELPHAWMTGLTTEQKADADMVKALEKFPKGIPELAKSYVELEKKVAGAVVVPNEKSTPEEKAAYLKAIGVPNKPQDYKLEDLKLPVPKQEIAAIDNDLAEIAHTVGLTQGQMDAVRKWHWLKEVESMKSRLDAMPTAAQCAETLKRQYGAQFTVAIEQANRAYDRFVKDPLKAKISATGLANDPEAVAMFAEIGKLIAEAPFVDGKSGQQTVSAYGKRSDAELAEALHGSTSTP